MFNFLEQYKHGYSFRRRILIIVSLSLFLLSLLIGTISSLHSTSQIKDILFTQGEQWSQTLADNSGIAFLYKNGDAVNNLVQTLMRNKTLQHIELIDDTGTSLFHKGTNKATLTYPGNYSGNQKSLSTDDEWLFSVKVYAQPIHKNTDSSNTDLYATDLLTQSTPDLLGYVNMSVSKAVLKSARNSIFASTLSIAIFISLLLIFVLNVLIGRLFMPLDKLSKTMERIRLGEWIGLEGSPNTNELNSIYIAFNAMTKALEIRGKELHSANKNLEAIVKRRTKELEESNHDLKSFNYSVSHDLRAPLRSISGFSKIILEDFGNDLPEDAQIYLDRIIVNTNRMNSLIEDLLMLSRISLQDIKYQDVDLTPIINTIVDNYRFEHKDADIRLILPQDILVQGDLGLMQIVMDNLVSNAIKYSSKKEHIKIEIDFSQNYPKTLRISDNGSGFDMRFADKLFSPFQRLHSPNEFEGSGIGLAIVKRIIDKHNGSVRIESEVDKGTSVYIEFNS